MAHKSGKQQACEKAECDLEAALEENTRVRKLLKKKTKELEEVVVVAKQTKKDRDTTIGQYLGSTVCAEG